MVRVGSLLGCLVSIAFFGVQWQAHCTQRSPNFSRIRGYAWYEIHKSLQAAMSLSGQSL